MKCKECGDTLIYHNEQMVCPTCMLKEARRDRCSHCLFLDNNRVKWHCLWYKEGKQPEPKDCKHIIWSLLIK